MTEPITEDLHRRFGVDAVTVTNGYDPGLDAEVDAVSLPPLPTDRLLVVHTGTLSGLRGRDPRPLLEALSRIALSRRLPRASRSSRPARSSPRTRSFFARCASRDSCTLSGLFHGVTALALQRRADALVLITSDDVSQSTAKLYEYLAARKPIIALAEDNEAARIVRDTQRGRDVAPTTSTRSLAALRRVASGDLVREYAPRDVERYIYPAPAEAIVELVETAIRAAALEARTHGRGSRTSSLSVDPPAKPQALDEPDLRRTSPAGRCRRGTPLRRASR